MITPTAGSQAPNFTLTAQDGSTFTLSDELKQQPVVLVFYTMDGSPNCDRLLCRINAEVDEFKQAGLKVVGINYAEPDAHAHYAKKRYLQMPLLSDDSYRVAEAYGSLFSIGPIRAIRYSVVGIGQDGYIKFLRRGRPCNQEIIQAMSGQTAA